MSKQGFKVAAEPFRYSVMGLGPAAEDAEVLGFVCDCLAKAPGTERNTRILLAVAALHDLPLVRDPMRRREDT